MHKPRQFGRYILIDRISTGGMAEVYLAKSSGIEGFEKIVAIKRILPAVSEDPDFETMFIDEAKISARLAHSNVGQVYEFGQVDGQYYIAMEYIPGKDLRAIQTHLEETDRVMDAPMALHIISRLCQALDYAHRQKDSAGNSMEIIHRDISPPNIIVSFEGAIKLIDFGIAKATSRATRTRAGKLKGKFAYMSPEQVQGMPMDHRSDIFSAGTLLHELLTNRRLFQGESQLAVMHAVRNAEVDPPSTINPEVPLEVDKIALQALARDRERRYGWASELRADIERYFARSSMAFDTAQLAQWMQTEFAGDVLAENRLRERLHAVTADEPPEGWEHAQPQVVDIEPINLPRGEEEEGPTATDGQILGEVMEEMAPTGRQRALSDVTGEPNTAELDAVELDAVELATVRHSLADDRHDTARELDEDVDILAETISAPPVDVEQPRLDTDRELLSSRRDTDREMAAPRQDAERELAEDRRHTGRDLAPRHDTSSGHPRRRRHTNRDFLPPPAADARRDTFRDVAADSPELAIEPRDTDRNVLGDTDLQPMAEDFDPRGSGPQVIGPTEKKEHRELVNWPTEFDAISDQPGLDAGPTRIEPVPPTGMQTPIAPGPDRNGATVGGALEVDSDPDRAVFGQQFDSDSSVAVAGIDGVLQTNEVFAPPDPHTPISGTQELGNGKSRRFSSLHVIIIAAGLTLLLAGLISVPLLVCSSDDPLPGGGSPESVSGTIIVTTKPPASCSVSLDAHPKGLLAPGQTLSLTRVPVGKHQVQLVCAGFQSYSTIIEVHRTEVTFVEAPLKKE
jgi:serine/threonine protein kinase